MKPVKLAKHMDEAHRFIDLAHQLDAPYVRVFPNQFVPGEDKRVTFDRISSSTSLANTPKARESPSSSNRMASHGYKGYYCFEWEKCWHPEIDEPEVAFPHYAKTIREYLAEAGVKT